MGMVTLRVVGIVAPNGIVSPDKEKSLRIDPVKVSLLSLALFLSLEHVLGLDRAWAMFRGRRGFVETSRKA